MQGRLNLRPLGLSYLHPKPCLQIEIPLCSVLLERPSDSSAALTSFTKERQRQKPAADKRSGWVGDASPWLSPPHSISTALPQSPRGLAFPCVIYTAFGEFLCKSNPGLSHFFKVFLGSCHTSPFNPLNATNHSQTSLTLACFLKPFRNTNPISSEPFRI